MLFSSIGYTFLPSSFVWANPTGEVVVGGAATFDRQGSTLTVNQATDRLAVNWQDFSIAAGETTHFNMPSSASIALNRVLGGNPSQIYGTLSSNGNIILVNNAGIFVGPGGVVNAASFVGSTLDIDPNQFMNAGQGGYHLHGDSYAPIVNQGSITAEKGDVFLIAQKVENRGGIFAPNGRAALVGPGRAADRTEVVLHEVGGSGFAVRVTQLEGEAAQGSQGGLPDGEELLNEGEIAAAQAELNASGNIYALAIKNTGTIRAKAVVANADGTVRLDGGLGDVRNTGTLIAKNAGDEATAAGGSIEVTGQNVTATPESIITAAGGPAGGGGGKVKIDSQDTTIVQGKVDVSSPSVVAQGGKVELLGEKVGLLDGAKVDASGGAGGGRVLVGGDYLGGQTPSAEFKDLAKQEAAPVKNAKAVVMADTAEVKADATARGDGGKIILWSDEYTGFYGELFARGGAEGGNGGFVETSSKLNLQAFGSVRASAALGEAGLWLLDPTDVTITVGSLNGSFSGGNPNVFTPAGTPTGAGATASVVTINNSLTAGTSVTVLTASADGQTGNITVAAAIDGTGNLIGNLSLVADGAIFVNTPIQNRGGVSLTAANGAITVNDFITSTDGSVQMITSSGDIEIGARVEATLGGISLQSSGVLLVGSTVQAATGILFTTGGNVEIDGGTVQNTGGAGNIIISSNGGIIIDGRISTVGTTGLGGNIFMDANGGNVGGTGVVILENPATATGSSLGIQATGNVDVFVSMPVVGQLSTTIPWDVQNAGPAMSIDAGGTVLVRNALTTVGLYGDVGSALVSGVVNGIIGLNSGGNMELNAGNGNIILGGATVISGGTFVARAAEPTAGIIFKAPSDRVTPAVTSAGRQTYFNIVTLNAAAGLPATAPAGSAAQTYLSGAGLQFRAAINDGSIDGGLTGVNIVNTGRESLQLLNTGVTEFLDYVGTARTSTDGLGGIVHLGPLYQFRQEGGSINFYATGTASVPGGIGTTLGPSIYVQDNPAAPNLPGGGSASFDNANIILFSNTYITGQSDITFSGTINSDFIDKASPFVVSTLGRGGQVIFNGAVGTAAPLGALTVTATGTSPDGKNAQININQGAVTYAATTPIKDGANGAITLTADGAIILLGGVVNTTAQAGTIGGGITLNSGGGTNENIQIGATINTRGGAMSFLDDVFFTGVSVLDTTAGNDAGDVTFQGAADGAFAVTINAGTGVLNFQNPVGASAPFNLTVGSAGGVDFDNAVLLAGGANQITSVSGPVTFDSTLDKQGGVLILDLGEQSATFTGQVGSTAQFDFNFVRSGGVTFSAPTLLGSGATVINSLAGNVTFADTLNKLGGAFTMDLGTRSATFQGPVGGTNPFGMLVTSAGGISFNAAVRMGGAFTFNNLTGPFSTETAPGSGVFSNFDGNFALTINPVSAGGSISLGTLGAIVPLTGLFIADIDATTTLYGDITTEGGGLLLGSPTVLATSININTTALGNAGGGVNFRNTLNGISPGDQDLNITAGTGAVTFGSRVGGSSALRDLTVNSGGSFSFSDAADLTVTRNILVVPDASSPNNILLSAGGNVEFRQGITARPGNGPGRNLTITAGGNLVIGGSINVAGRSGTFIGFAPDGSAFTFATAGAKGGTVTLNAASITTGTINANGSDNFVTGGNGGDGGTVILTSASDLITGPINVSGGTDGDLGGRGGTITLVRSGATGDVSLGTLTAIGGASNKGVGAAGGTISITASLGNLSAPTDFLLQGGDGSEGFVAGQGGTVTLAATAGSLSFANSTLNLTGDVEMSVAAGTHLILATVANYTTPGLSTGGVVIQTNRDSPRLDRRGTVAFTYGSANTGGTFFMPSSSYVISNGGDIRVDVRDGAGGAAAGSMTLSGLSTSGDNVNGGRILLNSTPGAGGLGAVSVLGALETLGGVPTTPTYGRAGGSVFIAGSTVSVGRIDTSGSNSLETATVPAFGGAAGDIEIRGTSGITLRRGLVATGGQGQGTGDANGGGGGSILLSGDVTLNSGSSERTSITLNTQGGVFDGEGDYGQGGSITLDGNLNGTATTSNTLDLRYGSGRVVLGSTGDTLTLGTLITAADDARSQGILTVNGTLLVDSLVTYGRGYSIELAGDGSTIGNAVTFLNQGPVTLGGTAGQILTFTGGYDTINGATFPASLNLGGTLVSGPGSGAGMAAGVTVLIADTTLDSNGNTITIGQLDATTAEVQGLTLAAGIGSGEVNFTSQVGGVRALGAIVIEGGATTAAVTSVEFADQVRALSMASGANSLVRMEGNVALSDAADLQGTTILNNTLENQALAFSTGTASSIGTLQLEGIAEGLGVQFSAASDLNFTTTVSGDVNLILAGAGLKNFQATVTVGTGTDASVQLNQGSATFAGNLVTSAGLTSALGTTFTFNGNVSLAQGDGTQTALAGTTQLGAISFTSNNTLAEVLVSGAVTLLGNVTLGGTGAYLVGGAVNGGGAGVDSRSITLAGSNTAKVFAGVVGGGAGRVSGFTQDTGSGTVTFRENVTTTGSSIFNDSVTLDGLVFTTGLAGTTTFGSGGTDVLLLSSGTVTLGGNGNYTVNAATTGGLQSLTLSGTGDKTFQTAISSVNTLAISTGRAFFNASVGGVTYNQSGGIVEFEEDVAFSGASTLGGTSTTLKQLNFFSGASTLVTGSLISTGNTEISGGPITLNTASAVTSSSGVLTLGSSVSLGQATTLTGAGAFQLDEAVTGAQSLTFSGAGAKTFSSTVGSAGTRLTGLTQNALSGDVTFEGNVFSSGLVTMNARTIFDGISNLDSGGVVTLNALLVNTAATIATSSDNISIGGATTLNAGLTLNDNGGGAVTSLNSVSGTSSNLNITTDSIALTGPISTGSGLITLIKAGGTALEVGGAGDFLTAAEINQIGTSGGLTIQTAGNIELLALAAADTDGITGPLRFNSTGGIINVSAAATVPLFGGVANSISNLNNLTTTGFNDLTVKADSLNYTTTGGLSLTGVSARDGIDVSSLGAMALGGVVNSSAGGIAVTSGAGITSAAAVQAAGTVSMTSAENLRVSGSVAGAAVRLDPAGNLVANGATFSSPDIRAVTRDFFAFFPGSAGIAGTQLVFGANNLAQLGPNQVGVALPFLAGAGAPYITEFTTGTGQPYVLATQENAVPIVVSPAALTFAGAFPTRVTYTEEDLEMMTPEERSALEAGRRQQAARVILQRQGGQAQEVGLPSEGEIPQAKAPVFTPPAPTAQVFLDGKPLAARQGPEKKDSIKMLRGNGRAVALRLDLDSQQLLGEERFAAELGMGSIPVAASR